METEFIRIVVLLVALGIVHWGLVPLALENLLENKRKFKKLWAMAIMSLTCFGSLFYFLVYPEENESVR